MHPGVLCARWQTIALNAWMVAIDRVLVGAGLAQTSGQVEGAGQSRAR